MRVLKDITVFQVAGAAAVIASAALLGMWISERTPPTVQISADVDPGPHRPGARVLVREEVARHKICTVRIEKLIFDAELVRYTLPEEFYVAAPGPVGVEKFAEAIRIPSEVALGPAFIRIIKVYYCNPLHHLWPVTAPTIQLHFEIRGEPLPPPPAGDGARRSVEQ